MADEPQEVVVDTAEQVAGDAAVNEQQQPQEEEQTVPQAETTQEQEAGQQQMETTENQAEETGGKEEQQIEATAEGQKEQATGEVAQETGETQAGAGQEEVTTEQAATEEESPKQEETTQEQTQEEEGTGEVTQDNTENQAEAGQEAIATEQEATQEVSPKQEQVSPQEPQQEQDTQQAPSENVAQETSDVPPNVPEPTMVSETSPLTVTQVTTSTGPRRQQQQEAEVDPHAPSPEPKYAKDGACTVKFVLMPSGQVHTMRAGLGQTLMELKDLFAKEIKVSSDILMFMFDAKPLNNAETLGSLGVGPNGTVQLEITSSDPATPLKPVPQKESYQMPDVITVRVIADSGEVHDVVVEIERPMKKKPFLGGYRHKVSGIEFHHAAAQTAQKPRPPSNVERYCRDTQTSEQKHEVQQTTNNMSTQMTKIGVYVSNIEDKLMVPGKYQTADEFHGNVFNRVLTIQKYYRRWLAKRYVEKVRSDKAKREEWERLEEIRKRKEKEDRIRHEFERRMNPKSREDFDLLYHALEKWRQEELERIDSELTGAERKAALCQLLDSETQLIASIGRHKLDADTGNKTKQIQGFLEKAASPKKWKGPDGKTTEMDTPYTIRAQELRDIYNSINMKYLTQDERLDVLLTLKHTVKEHDCKLTQEIIELIDREADLLMRGVKESNLDGLRKRISTLFLQYIKTPTFNPEAARLLKVPQDPSVLRKDIYFCPSCNQYKPSTEFQLSSNSRNVGRCRKCTKIDNDARVRHDYSHYRYMLKSLRRSEEAYTDESKMAYLLQERDLRYLVENVWNGQSIMSAWEDLYDLVLVRWDKHTEWSPWNCILLTKEEAASHDKLENLDEAYGKTLIHKVKHNHTLARTYFSRLPGMAEYMRKKLNSTSSPQGPSVSGKAVSVAPAVDVH